MSIENKHPEKEFVIRHFTRLLSVPNSAGTITCGAHTDRSNRVNMSSRERTESNIKYAPATEEDKQKAGNCGAKSKAWFTQFPRATWPILLTEFGERFSYYGIKTVLVLYLTKDLLFNKSDGKAIYHAFSMTSYFTGVIGAMIADSFLGKYRTIAYTLFAYCLSEMLLTATSADTIGNRSSIGPLVGLFLMAIACGNIKPCLAAFGGDQFRTDQEHLLDLFFAMFYASVNVGAVLCMYFIPIVRTDVRCYDRDCYPAVFGINTVLIIMAFLAFIAGKRLYTMKDPAGNVFIKVIKIVCHALGHKMSGSGPPNTVHWLDNALDTYEQNEVNDVRMLLRVLVMYIPLPVFWALFHQQGSSWTLQAEQMDGDLGPLGTLRSDQMQALNPILVLILIPLYDGVIYPMFERCRLPLLPLKRMTGGLGLAGVAFVICAFVQIKIQTVGVGPSVPSSGHTSVEFINTIPCDVSVNPSSFFRVDLKYGERSKVYKGQFGRRTFDVLTTRCNVTGGKIPTILEDQSLVSVVIGYDDTNQVTISKSIMTIPGVNIETAVSRLRILYMSNGKMLDQVDVKLDNLINKKQSIVLENLNISTNQYHKVQTGEYQISEVIGHKGNTSTVYKAKSPTKLKLDNFGAFTVVINPVLTENDKFDVAIHEDATGTSVSRLWQVPQYVVLTAAEVMFSVTGLGFAYSQAPASMKSVLQSFWLLTVAFGDFLVVILSTAKPVKGVDKEMFLYGGLMGVIMIIFGIMSYFYKYVTPEDISTSEGVLRSEPNGDMPLEEKKSSHSEDTKI